MKSREGFATIAALKCLLHRGEVRPLPRVQYPRGTGGFMQDCTVGPLGSAHATHRWAKWALFLLAFIAGAFAFFVTPAAAQNDGIDNSASPPKYQWLAAGTVDPKTGELVLSTSDLSVGSGEFPSRIELVRVQSSRRRPEFTIEGRALCSNCTPYTLGNGTYPANFHPSTWSGVDIVLFGTTYSFSQNSSGGFDNLKRDGATLVRDASDRRFEFHTKQGVKAYFDYSPALSCGQVDARGQVPIGNLDYYRQITCQRVRYVEWPDGQSMTYKYTSLSVRTSYGAWSSSLPVLSEVINSRGYGIRFSYGRMSDDINNFQWLLSATGFRASCVQSAAVNCAIGTMPSVTYGYTRFATLQVPYEYRLTSATDAEGNKTVYEYNSHNFYQITGVKYPQNPTISAITIRYSDESNSAKVVALLDALQKQTSFDYAASTTTITNPLSQVARFGFSGTKPLPDYVEAVDSAGIPRRTTYTYDSFFRVTSVQSPEGVALDTSLDDRGNVTTARRKAKSGSGLADLVATAEFPPCDASNYRTCNQPTYVIDERGQRTDFGYDPSHGGLTTVITPPDASGRRLVTRAGYATYTAAANTEPPALAGVDNITPPSVTLATAVDLCLSTQPGVTSNFVCPAADVVRTSMSYTPSTVAAPSSFELTAVSSDPAGANVTSSVAIDQVGNVISEDGPRADADVTSYAYDRLRRPTLLTAPTTTSGTPKILHTYDKDGRLIRTQQSLGGDWITSSITYDTRGLPIGSVGSDGSLTSFSYTDLGQPYEAVETVDGAERRSRRAYDALGRMTSVREGVGSPLEQAIASYSYSPDGQVLTQTDAGGHISTFCYDGFNRLVERRYPDPLNGLAPDCIAVPAGGPLPARVTRERWVYASNGDLVTVVLRDGRSINYTYDGTCRLVGKNVPEANRDLVYSYDLLGRRVAADLPGPNAPLSVSWTYDKLSRVTSSTGPYGRQVSYTYDPGLAVMATQWPDGFSTSSSSDVLGRVTSISEAVPLATYQYDELSRRTFTTLGNGTQTQYGYDAHARLASLTHDFPGTARDVTFGLIYNDASELLSRTRDNNAYAYTDAMNTAREYRALPGGPLGGNGLNQYSQITQPQPVSNDLTYDSTGNLANDNTPNGSSDFGYDSDGRLTFAHGFILTYDAIGRLAAIASGSLNTQFLYDGQNLIGEYDGTSGALLRRTVSGPGIDEPLVVYNRGVRSWLYSDDHGSIIAEAGNDGSVVGINAYDAWGVPALSNAGRFGFAGMEWLPEIGLYHVRARSYSPSLGRFLQPDPIGERGGMNLYNFALNDPVNQVDPLGLYAGVDDLAFMAIGATVNVGLTVASDLLIKGETSAGRIAGAAVTGALMGEGALYIPVSAGTSVAVAGAFASGVGSVTEQLIDNGSIDWRKFAFDATLGGLTSKFIPAGVVSERGLRTSFLTLSAGANSWHAIGKTFITKFRNGTISQVTSKTAFKGAIGRYVHDMPGAVASAAVAGVPDVAQRIGSNLPDPLALARAIAAQAAQQGIRAAQQQLRSIIPPFPSVITVNVLGPAPR